MGRRAVLVLLSVLVVLAAGTATVTVQAAAERTSDGQEAALPPGSALPSDEECAHRVRRDPWEPRPENTEANRTTPPGPIESTSWGSPEADALHARVTGAFTGTTDEILQWASCKWGFDTDITRAQAAQESEWFQSRIGDGGISFGIMQVKSTQWVGTAPWSASSTSYNVDWTLGLRRACFEGFIFGEEARGDLWGCIGAHFSGLWLDPLAVAYIDKVRARLAAREWLTWPSERGQPPTSRRPIG